MAVAQVRVVCIVRRDVELNFGRFRVVEFQFGGFAIEFDFDVRFGFRRVFV